MTLTAGARRRGARAVRAARTAVSAVVRLCTVHNALRRAPDTLIELNEVES